MALREELLQKIKARGVRQTSGCYTVPCYGGPFDVDDLDEEGVVALAQYLGIETSVPSHTDPDCYAILPPR
jgi:hypothetical protein